MARDFNGSTQRLEGSLTGTTNPQKFTVAAWINADTRGEGGTGIIFRLENAGAFRFKLAFSSSVTDAMVAVIGTTTGNITAHTPASSVVFGSWVHVAVTYDGTLSATSRFTMSISGVSQTLNYTESNGGSEQTADTFYIGGRSNGTNWFDGDLAEISQWNKVLTAQQIKDLSDGLDAWTVDNASILRHWEIYGTASPEPESIDSPGQDASLIASPPQSTHPDIVQQLPAFTAMATASRTTGVAPLSVYFDAIPAASGVAQPSASLYEEQFYEWDFDDLGAGTWTNGRANWGSGNLSKNRAVGYGAAHVFENPGSYDVKLRLIKQDGTTIWYNETITVSADTKTTLYFADAGDDTTGDGSIGNPYKTITKMLTLLGQDKKFLFNRGDSFPWGTGEKMTLSASGMHFGAYGSGARPIWSRSDVENFVTLASGATDTRFVDLDISAPVSNTPSRNIFDKSGACQRALFLRCKWVGLVMGLNLRGSGSSGWNFADELCVQECECPNCWTNPVMVAADKIAFLGNDFGGSQAEHCIRIPYCVKGVISNNWLHDPGNGRLAIKLHNTQAVGQSPPDDTYYVTISDNKLRGHHACAILGPQNDTLNELVHDCVVERNYFVPCTRFDDAQTGMLGLSGPNLTARNNVLDLTANDVTKGSNNPLGINIVATGAGPDPDNARVYNNTMWCGTADSGTEGAFCVKDSNGTGHDIKNNVIAAPDLTNVSLVDAIHASNIKKLTADIDFESVTPGSEDFRIQTTSDAKDAGVDLAGFCRDDLLGRSRVGETYDSGAHEFGASAFPPPAGPATRRVLIGGVLLSLSS